MSVSAAYLEATVIAAAAAREQDDLEVFVNISQMTVSQMSLTRMTGSPQHRQHLLAEMLLNCLPVVSIARERAIRLPFGPGRTSPVACQDVAEVMAAILTNPSPHLGKIYELTGPRSEGHERDRGGILERARQRGEVR